MARTRIPDLAVDVAAPPVTTIQEELSVSEDVFEQEVVQSEQVVLASETILQPLAAQSNANIVMIDKLNGQTYGYAAAHDLLGSGTSVNMGAFPRSIYEITNNTATPLPVNVPGGPSVTVPANGTAALSTHPNIAPGKSVQGKTGSGGAVQGYSF